jgi:hypothetical protein
VHYTLLNIATGWVSATRFESRLGAERFLDACKYGEFSNDAWLVTIVVEVARDDRQTILYE